MGSSKASLIDRLSELTIPVRIMRARQREGERGTMDFSASPTWPELAERLPMGTDQYLPELTHLFQCRRQTSLQRLSLSCSWDESTCRDHG